MTNILQIPVPSGNPAIAWSSRESGVNTLLFINPDLNNYVYLGQEPNITAAGGNVIPLAPNGTFSGDASSRWYVVGSVAGITPLVVVPNGQAYFLGITQGLGNLVIPSVQSPNFVTGLAGWQIKKDGSAEFNNLTLRGVFKGSNYIINSSGEFFYSGTPAANNLLMSLANANSTDSFGNHYIAGFWIYTSTSAIGFASGSQVLGVLTGSQAAGWGIATVLSNDGSNTFIDGANSIVLNAPVSATSGTPGNPSVITTDSWHTASLVNSWAGSGSATNGLFYRLTTENVVQIIGDLASPGTASVITTLPAAYRPATQINIEFNRYDDSGTAHATVDTSGVVTMQTVVGAGKGLFTNAFIPLGAL